MRHPALLRTRNGERHLSTGRLWAARHAPVVAAGLCYGRDEPPTTLPPEAAAAVLGDHCAHLEPAEVWSSPSHRCRSVAEALARQWGVPLRLDERLWELSFGRWEGRPWEDIRQEDAKAFSAWAEAWLEEGPPGGESARALEDRVRSWWTELSGTPLLVGHAGVLRALRVVTRGMSWAAVMAQPVPYLAPEPFSLPSASASGP